jgi:hypothetical protein
VQIYMAAACCASQSWLPCLPVHEWAAYHLHEQAHHVDASAVPAHAAVKRRAILTRSYPYKELSLQGAVVHKRTGCSLTCQQHAADQAAHVTCGWVTRLNSSTGFERIRQQKDD